jgi:hypothetical protein
VEERPRVSHSWWPTTTPMVKRDPRPAADGTELAPRPPYVRNAAVAVKRYDPSPLFHRVQCRRTLRRAILALTSAAAPGGEP